MVTKVQFLPQPCKFFDKKPSSMVSRGGLLWYFGSIDDQVDEFPFEGEGVEGEAADVGFWERENEVLVALIEQRKVRSGKFCGRTVKHIGLSELIGT
jgi:hypothetical protein